MGDRWNWRCSEEGCNFRYMVVKDSDTPYQFSNEDFSGNMSSNPTEVTENGEYLISIQAKDRAGNVSEVITDTFVNEGIRVMEVSYTPGHYTVGDNIDVNITFNQGVVVVGNPRLHLLTEGGNNFRYISYHEGQGISEITFRYQVQDTDVDDDGGLELGNNGMIDLNGGSIRSAIDNEDAQLVFTDTVFSDIIIDVTPPTLSITSNHGDDIDSSNAANYQVSGTCESGLAVEVRIEDIAPEEDPICTEEGTWQASLNVGNLDESSNVQITAAQIDLANNRGEATPISASVGTFPHIFFPLKKLDGSAGSTCVVKHDGKVSCWGNNDVGQLGRGTNDLSYYAEDVIGSSGEADSFLTNIVQVSVALGHTCALRADGKVLCWGLNYYGQLGLNHKENKYYPHFVHGLHNQGHLGSVVQVTTGYQQSCALLSDGRVGCWGNNNFRQLGNQYSYRDNRYPRIVRLSDNGPPLKGIIQIATGYTHTCALTSTGNIYCWGQNWTGQLGNGEETEINSHVASPVMVIDSTGTEGSLLSDIKYITTGDSLSCGIKSNNDLYCWGVLTVGPPYTQSYPRLHDVYQNVSTPELGHSLVYGHLCSLTTSGTIYCSGYGLYGQFSRGTTYVSGAGTISLYPLTYNPPVHIRATQDSNAILKGVIELGAAGYTNCGLMVTGNVKCWGKTRWVGIGESDGYTFSPQNVLLDANTSLQAGVGKPHYACRENFSRCVMSSVSLSAGGSQSNPTNAASPIIRVTGVNNGEEVTIYSDQNCGTAFTGGTVIGTTEFDTQTVTLTDAIADGDEIFLSYRVENSPLKVSHCFKSDIILDRIAPSNAIITLGPALSLTPTVTITGMTERETARIYFEDSTCSNAENLLAEETYYGLGNLEIEVAPEYAWSVAEGVPEGFVFHVVIEDLAGNLSDCITSSAHYALNPGTAK